MAEYCCGLPEPNKMRTQKNPKPIGLPFEFAGILLAHLKTYEDEPALVKDIESYSLTMNHIDIIILYCGYACEHDVWGRRQTTAYYDWLIEIGFLRSISKTEYRNATVDYPPKSDIVWCKRKGVMYACR